MKRTILLLLLAVPLWTQAQGSFSNGYGKGTDGVITLTSLVGSFGTLEPDATLTPPTIQASNIAFAGVFSTQMQMTFVRGNGSNALVVIKAGSPVNFVPANNNVYSPGAAGGGNIIVSTGTSSVVPLTGLIPATTYHVAIFEFNDYSGHPQYLTPGAPTASRATLPLPNVYVTAPANGAINQNVTLNVTSIALTGAATYTIELNDAADFTGTSFIKSGSRTQNFTGLQYGTTYFTRVKTNLSPDYGMITSFNTTIPSTQVITPVNGAINQNVSLNVTAASVMGATVYTIELNDASDFTGTSIVRTGARTQNFTGLLYDQVYYTRVKTNNYPVFGASTSFRTAIPNVYVSNPANLAIDQNISLNVVATNFAGATSYTIDLNTASDFTGTGFSQTGGRIQNFSGLAFDKTYYARVKTDVSPVYGKTTSFSTAKASKYAYVTAPANNAMNVNNAAVNITSNLVPTATSYTIQLSESPDFAVVAFEQTGMSRTLAFAGLKYNTTYYNQVITDVSTEYGQVRSFTTRTSESLAYVAAPANNAVNVSYNVNVRSNAVPGAALYTIELNTMSDFTGTSIVQSSPSATMAFNGLAYNTTYYNRVKTDLSPNWGVHRQFTTTSPAAYSYITSPANHSTGNKWVLNLTSNTVPDATQYTIEVNTLSDFTGISTVKIGSRTVGFTVAKNQTYYTRVKTDLSPVWGVTTDFQTGDEVNLAFVTSPANNASGVPTTVSVVANALPGAVTYTIELNNADDFTGAGIVKSGARTQSFTGLREGTTYHTRVRTNLAPGMWGPPGSFTTINPLGRVAGDWHGTDSDSDTTVVAESSFRVYPNPFAHKFTFHVEDLDQMDIHVQLIDINGAVLRSWHDQTNRLIEVEHELPQGVYILRVVKGEEVLVKKVMRL